MVAGEYGTIVMAGRDVQKHQEAMEATRSGCNEKTEGLGAEGATILSFSWDDPRCPDVCETVVLLAGIVWRYSIYHLYKSSKKVLPCISMIKRV